MVWESPKDAMPWVGLYVSLASFICAFAMAADAVQAIWQWKLWFPNRFFTLNASTITLIAIAMKLPVDLTSNRCEGIQVSQPCDPKAYNNPSSLDFTKMIGLSFLVTMLGNFLPSLGLMDDKELLVNIVAIGILVITIGVNIGIQLYTQVLFLFLETIPIFLFAFISLLSVALTVSTSRKRLEHRYNESQKLLSTHQEKIFSSKELGNYVKKCWMMTETRNPQFVIACSPVSSAFGVICLYLAFRSGVSFVGLVRFKAVSNTSTRNVSLEVEQYSMYVVQIEEEAKLSNRILRNTLRYITRLISAFEQKEPRNLMMLLEKSRGFNGLSNLENDKVQHLYPEEARNCWSLVVVTLASAAIALPHIANGGLLAGISEGLLIVRHIEKCLNVDGDTVKARKAARRLWTEVEIYRSWLQIDLQKMARKEKTSNEILKWLGDEAEKIVKQFKSNKNQSIDQSSYNKFILASSMYRICQTILLHSNEQGNGSNDEQLFEWITTLIADVLLACFTNLPCVIKMKCHHHAIEKRGENIRNAAKILGKSKKILKVLKACQLPNIDLDSMAYIDQWCVLSKSQLPDGIASSQFGIHPAGSSSCNESLILSII
ncbi:hypothetical protein E3N88_42155 [Mikania micrantha]|uniref:DUF4220 domain-containing protein n=1 Tax=Mikania micrantha TaxID=192012 RepID=A0A5N6LIJ5_9ASTR|nr:hypothetical protein E3N88_42155 [Mikania micrantha]